MRRSTAAAVGTLTGAALILGVRLSVQPPAVPVAAAAPVDAGGEPDAESTGEPAPAGTKKPSGKKTGAPSADDEKKKEEEAGLKAGTYKGKAVQNQYGTIQVTIKVGDGKITSADATYPTDGFSGTINPKAVQALSSATLEEQSADVEAVSGATFTSQSYVTSLQAALDKAGA
ncbi:FMN-binding protein [Actinoplanes sp. NPDC049802]|uniref:FMN-binding protein n=1 Tax=Actinoplanes sp. NPDC049802 TaxID=3154742 RepID=UPI0033CD199B